MKTEKKKKKKKKENKRKENKSKQVVILTGIPALTPNFHITPITINFACRPI
jgi:hypothetical protein